MSSRKDFGQRADGPTKSNQSFHSSPSCSSGCSIQLSFALRCHTDKMIFESAGQSRYFRLTKIIQILWPGVRVTAERVLRLSTCGRLGWRKDLDVLSIFFVVHWAGRVWLTFRVISAAVSVPSQRYANNEKGFQNFEFSFRKPVVLFRSLYSTVCSHMEPSAKLGSPNWTLESKS